MLSQLIQSPPPLLPRKPDLCICIISRAFCPYVIFLGAHLQSPRSGVVVLVIFDLETNHGLLPSVSAGAGARAARGEGKPKQKVGGDRGLFRPSSRLIRAGGYVIADGDDELSSGNRDCRVLGDQC